MRYYIVTEAKQQSENDMKTFTKSYEVAPNKAQKEAMKRAFTSEVTAALMDDLNVEVIVKHFQGKDILVSVIVEGQVWTTRKIGVNGGLTVI